jgi:glycogen debranching enzyme
MDVEREARRIYQENRQFTSGHQYTLPSLRSYPYQWLWDSCFHAIVLAHLEPEAAKEELRSLVSKQFEDGMIPHMIYWQSGDLHRYEWGKDGTSALTQTPMIAYAVEEIYKQDGDKAFLREIYPSLWKFYKYLIDKRDPRKNNLVSIINPDESGEDNSPRFDEVLGLDSHISLDDHLKERLKLIEKNIKCNFDAENCMKNHFWVKDVLFNSVLVANLESLEHLASELGIKDDADFIKKRISVIKFAMRKLMYEDGIFWSTYGSDYKKIKVNTWANFAPLFAKLYTEEEAQELVRNHLFNEDTFLSPYGIRTVSKQEPSYRPSDSGFSWRGPIWFVPHWIIYKGLGRYGFEKEREMILKMSLALLEKEGFREDYNPETGEGMGAENFTWGTLVVDMMRDKNKNHG